MYLDRPLLLDADISNRRNFHSCIHSIRRDFSADLLQFYGYQSLVRTIIRSVTIAVSHCFLIWFTIILNLPSFLFVNVLLRGTFAQLITPSDSPSSPSLIKQSGNFPFTNICDYRTAKAPHVKSSARKRDVQTWPENLWMKTLVLNFIHRRKQVI